MASLPSCVSLFGFFRLPFHSSGLGVFFVHLFCFINLIESVNEIFVFILFFKGTNIGTSSSLHVWPGSMEDPFVCLFGFV